MSKRMFTQEQIKELSENENVIRCSEKSITYSHDFKIKAVKQYHSEGLTPREIFRKAGFDLEVIGKRKPKGLMRDWNQIYRIKGFPGLLEENRGRGSGGRPKTQNLTDTDKIKRLEIEVAYLKAENDFLAKLRAKRAE
jgi:transposase